MPPVTCVPHSIRWPAIGAAGQAVPIVPCPAEPVGAGADGQTWVGHAAGDDQVGARAGQPRSVGPQIGIGRDEPVSARRRSAWPVSRFRSRLVFRVAGDGSRSEHVVAGDDGDRPAGAAGLLQGLAARPGTAQRVESARIGDDAAAPAAAPVGGDRADDLDESPAASRPPGRASAARPGSTSRPRPENRASGNPCPAPARASRPAASGGRPRNLGVADPDRSGHGPSREREQEFRVQR